LESAKQFLCSSDLYDEHFTFSSLHDKFAPFVDRHTFRSLSAKKEEKMKSQRAYNLKILGILITLTVFYFYIRKINIPNERVELELRHQVLDAQTNLSVSICVPILVEHMSYRKIMNITNIVLQKTSNWSRWPGKCFAKPEPTPRSLMTWFSHCGRLRDLTAVRLYFYRSSQDPNSDYDQVSRSTFDLSHETYINFKHYCLLWHNVLDLRDETRILFTFRKNVALTQLKMYVHQPCSFPEYPNQYSVFESIVRPQRHLQIRLQQLQITDSTLSDDSAGNSSNECIIKAPFQSTTVFKHCRLNQLLYNPEHCLQNCCKLTSVCSSNFMYTSQETCKFAIKETVKKCRASCASQCNQRRCIQSVYLQHSQNDPEWNNLVIWNLFQNKKLLNIELLLEPIGLVLHKRLTLPTSFYVSYLANLITIVFGFNVRSTLHLLLLIVHVHTHRQAWRQRYQMLLTLATVCCVLASLIQISYLVNQFWLRNVQSTFIVKLRRPLLKFSISLCFNACKLMKSSCPFDNITITAQRQRFHAYIKRHLPKSIVTQSVNLSLIDEKSSKFERLFIVIMVNKYNLTENLQRTHRVFYFHTFKCFQFDVDLPFLFRNEDIIQIRNPFLNKFFPFSMFLKTRIFLHSYFLSEYGTLPKMNALAMTHESQPIRIERAELPPPYAGSFCHDYRSDPKFSHMPRLQSIESCIEHKYFEVIGRYSLQLPQLSNPARFRNVLYDLKKTEEMQQVMQKCDLRHVKRDCNQVDYTDQFGENNLNEKKRTTHLDIPLLLNEHSYGQAPSIGWIDFIICLIGVCSVWFGVGGHVLLQRSMRAVLCPFIDVDRPRLGQSNLQQSQAFAFLMMLLCFFNVRHLIATYMYSDPKVISYMSVSKTVYPPIVSLCSPIQNRTIDELFRFSFFRQLRSLDSYTNLTLLSQRQMPLKHFIKWINFQTIRGEKQVKNVSEIDALQRSGKLDNLQIIPYFHLHDFCYAIRLDFPTQHLRELRMSLTLLTFKLAGKHVRVHFHSFNSMHRDVQGFRIDQIVLRITFFNFFRAWENPIGVVLNCIHRLVGDYATDKLLEDRILNEWPGNFTSTYLPLTAKHFNRTLKNKDFWRRLYKIRRLRRFRILQTDQCDLFHQMSAKQLISVRNDHGKVELCAGLLDTFMFYQQNMSLSELLLYVGSVMSFWLDFCLLRLVNRLIAAFNSLFRSKSARVATIDRSERFQVKRVLCPPSSLQPASLTSHSFASKGAAVVQLIPIVSVYPASLHSNRRSTRLSQRGKATIRKMAIDCHSINHH
jgi:hypothetical protein